jgi:hypothetical protein
MTEGRVGRHAWTSGEPGPDDPGPLDPGAADSAVPRSSDDASPTADDMPVPGEPVRRPRGLSRRSALLLGGGAGAGAFAAGAAGAVFGARSAAAAEDTGALFGMVSVEQFRERGRSDDDALAAAVRHAAAQTHKPAIVFANRGYDLTRPVRPFSGLHLRSFPYGDEFRLGQQITLPAGGLLTFDPDVRAVTLENLACRVRDHLLEPIPRDASAGAWTDVRVLGGGYDGGTTLVDGAVLRLDFQPSYVNNVTDSVVRVGGSDSWLFTRGPHYVSGTLPADRPFLDLDHLGQSVVGSAYVTAQGGYGVSISGGGTGLVLNGTLVDASGRSGAEATQQAGVQITGGTDTTLNDLWVFNANVSGESPGLVTVTGGTDIVLSNPRFPATNSGHQAADTQGPCIHTSVPITVITPKAPGRARLITATAPDLVTLVGAPGWEVRVV